MKSGSRFAAPRGEGTTMTLRMLGTGCLAWSLAASALGGAVAVSVANPPATGAVVALLFDSADAFADLRDPVATQTLAADGISDAIFEGLAPGRYAVLAFHDVNGNGILDLNFLGIPREPLGFSNRYWGKGAPTFAAAALAVGETERVPVDVELKKIFGKKGLFGVGLGAIAQSNPYRGADSARVLAIPAVTYVGERVQILGPLAQVGLMNWNKARLAATARYRLGAYDEDDSEYLEGMGDRKDSVFGGLAVQGELPIGLRASADYEHDVLDRVGGGSARLGVRRGFQFGRYSAAPGAGLNWLSAELAGHEFGVEADEARADRPAYRPGDAVNVELGLGLSAEWAGAWRVIANGSVEFLANELRESPLVERGWVSRAFVAVNYTF